jgi:hypothetical protein
MDSSLTSWWGVVLLALGFLALIGGPLLVGLWVVTKAKGEKAEQSEEGVPRGAPWARK